MLMVTALAMASAGIGAATPTAARFVCGPVVVVARFAKDRATLAFEGRQLRLARADVSDGVRYAGVAGSRRVEWLVNGDAASLSYGKRVYAPCRRADLPLG